MQTAGPEHAAALAAIHAASFPPAGRWGADAIALQFALPGAFGFIDPAGGMVLARSVADEAEILTLAVAPESRRAGLGRALLDAALDAAAAQGARVMFLEVAATNSAALALYARTGFVQVGRRTGYYGPGQHALIMRASLEPPRLLPDRPLS